MRRTARSMGAATHVPMFSEPVDERARAIAHDFSRRLIVWQRRHGRHDLPWQATRDPYAIWVSETMLQQTQVAAVVPYFQRFMQRFADIPTLAAASLDEVLRLWSGLGYYSRARNLHRAAVLIVERHAGAFPRRFEQMIGLPGIGRSTAGAIAACAFGQRRAILDGNVKRVLSRVFAVAGYPGQARVERTLWRLAEALVPKRGLRTYIQALMDVGALVCTRRAPRCGDCPLRVFCQARLTGKVEAFPAPRPRRRLPERCTIMLLLCRDGEILLEQRPPTGVWGGLWSLPELSPEEDPIEVSSNRYGARVCGQFALPELTHGFTHFRLRIRPLRLSVEQSAPRVAVPGCVWLPYADACGAALPVPVRRLINGLNEATRSV